ncbi:hypothetical protein [Crocosphaera sp.]|uniref:hypothetical protein n=1 Tax=Crocosphaera sp. TaxID=2729996 RepID=UPI003F22C996|nr:hypothetical protein [Crocosphaera sp.]
MKNETVKSRIFSLGEENKKPHKSLDPLAENFDFDCWAKMVKQQMKKSLQYPFSHYLSE